MTSHAETQSDIRYQIETIEKQVELRHQELQRLASRKEQLLHQLHALLTDGSQNR